MATFLQMMRIFFLYIFFTVPLDALVALETPATDCRSIEEVYRLTPPNFNSAK